MRAVGLCAACVAAFVLGAPLDAVAGVSNERGAATAGKPARRSLGAFWKATRAQGGHEWDRSSALNPRAFLHFRKTGALPVKQPQKVLKWVERSLEFYVGMLESRAKQSAPAAQRRDLRGRFYHEGSGSFLFVVGGAQVSQEYRANDSLKPMVELFETLGTVVHDVRQASDYAAAHPEQPQLRAGIAKLAARASDALKKYDHAKLTNSAGRNQLRLDEGAPGAPAQQIHAVARGLVELPAQIKALDAIAARQR